MAMTSAVSRPRRPRPPLGQAQLDELALAYVGRFATSRARLVAYLERKLRERGWEGERPADPGAVAERLCQLGYVDDSAFAAGRARSMARRGYGRRRVTQSLSALGIAEEDREEALAVTNEQEIAAAVRFARRRRLGPFAPAPAQDRAEREKAYGAMIRAGHDARLARHILELSFPDGDGVDEDLLIKNLSSRF